MEACRVCQHGEDDWSDVLGADSRVLLDVKFPSPSSPAAAAATTTGLLVHVSTTAVPMGRISHWSIKLKSTPSLLLGVALKSTTGEVCSSSLLKSWCLDSRSPFAVLSSSSSLLDQPSSPSTDAALKSGSVVRVEIDTTGSYYVPIKFIVDGTCVVAESFDSIELPLPPNTSLFPIIVIPSSAVDSSFEITQI